LKYKDVNGKSQKEDKRIDGLLIITNCALRFKESISKPASNNNDESMIIDCNQN